MAEPIRRGFLVRGRVQAVGFRWWTRRSALALGLRGTVRNMPDGAVEVRVEGEPEAVADLARLLSRGPAGARVTAVDEFEFPSPVPEGFQILP